MSKEVLELPKVETIGEDIPVAYYELYDQRDSGFIQEGTERLPDPIQITAPSVLMLRRQSHYFRKDDAGVPRRVPIRHIFGCEEIEVTKQKELNVEPNAHQDTIMFTKGKLLVVREGNTIGTYDFLKKHSGNASNPERDPTADIRFREVVPEKEKMDLNDFELSVSEAVSKVRALIISREGGKVKYDEEKMQAYCKLFNVTGETLAGKLNALISIAKTLPVEFMDQLVAFEGRFLNEIIQAETLHVIKYNANTIEYVIKPEVILVVQGAFQKKEELRKRLAAFFQSTDGAVAYQGFLAEIEAAKTREIN